MKLPSVEELIGIEAPLIQAPIGSATCPELAAAVSNAGALGMLALSWSDLHEVDEALDRTRQLTARPFGVNLVLEWPQHDRLLACLEGGVHVVSTFWGDPSGLTRIIHRHGALHAHSVGSVEDAADAVRAGVDILVAQGVEAGGHVRGTTPLRELLAAILAAAGPLPVLAAGGIATGAHAGKLMAAGAAGAWVGTRFLCSAEARVHSSYQQAILAAGPSSTCIGEVFTKGWESAPHRALRNATVERWLAAGRPDPGARPGEDQVIAWTRDGRPIERYSDVIPLPGMTGEVEELALYAGEGVAQIVEVQPAAAIVAEFKEGMHHGGRGD